MPSHLTPARLRLAVLPLEDRTTPATLLGLTDTDELLRFDSATPGTTTTVTITGLNVNESILGIDVRPANGLLYAVTTDSRLLTIDPASGATTLVAALTADPADATSPFIGLNGTTFGVDFNPVPDRLRLVSDTGQNLRINPDTGQVITDTGLNPGIPDVAASAYLNNFAGTDLTTLFGLDDAADRLVLQNPPNDGTLATVGTNLGAGIDVTIDSGFDIVTTGGGTTARVNTAFAALTNAGVVGLYTIDLTAGTATPVGAIGAGTTAVLGLAVVPAGTVNFSAASFAVNENGGTATIDLTRTGGTLGALTVAVNVSGGTASAGDDFTAGPYLATFDDGATTASISVPLTDDAIFEGNETVVLTIASVNNSGVVGTLDVHTLTITENDPQQSFTVPAANGFALVGGTLVPFSSGNPGAAGAAIPVTGVDASETLVAIDFRPQNGLLYGFGVNATANTGTLYTISTRTGVATPVGTTGAIAFVQADGTTPVDLPDPATVGYDIDFNPAVDRLRVVAGALNFRVNPNDGSPVDGNLNSGTPAGTNTDGLVNGGTATVQGTAYTNNFANNGGVTTQYTLDATNDSLFIQTPPNAGTQANPLPITLGGNPLDFTAVKGFDILADVTAPSANVAATGTGLAILTVAGNDALYRIDLTTGAATLFGPIAGATTAQSVAFQSELGGTPMIALNADGTQLLRFLSSAPEQVFAVPISGVNSGETLVGIDYRPATGQFYGLGVDATANTATLYRIDPQTGAAIAIGLPGGIAFVQVDGTTPVDFPDPLTGGYGFDFNPVADRVRVTTGSGLNFRVNPNNGAAVDGDLNSGTPPGVNTDGPVNGLPGGSTGVSATAYTNSFGGTAATTQYTLDAVSNFLFIQNPPNGGTQTNPLPITLGGNPLDFTEVGGFDISPGVRVNASNAAAPAGSRGYAVLTVGGVTALYEINLTTGAATLLGDVGDGGTHLAGLALAATPAGAVSFAFPVSSAGEGGNTLPVVLTRSGGSSGQVTVTVTPTAGTATAADADLTPIIVTFADGQTTATTFIPLIADTLDEADETLNLTLSNPTGGLVFADIPVAGAMILDDDTAGAVSFDAATYTRGESGGSLAIPLVRTGGSSGQITVTVTPTAGTATAADVDLTPFTVTFNDGQTSATAFILFGGDLLTGDALDEPDETFTLTLSAPTGGAVLGALTTATVTIVDDDPTPPVVDPPVPPGDPTPTPDPTPPTVPAPPVDDTPPLPPAPRGPVFVTSVGSLLTVNNPDGSTTTFNPYPGFLGGFTIARGDVNGDGVDDIITGAGANAHVKVFDGATGAEVRSFFAYVGFAGGVNVAAGDVNGDGFDDIITGAATSASHVKVFDGRTGAEIRSFFAYEGFPGGVKVASGDLNGDGFDDLITVAGPGGNGHVKAFSGADNSLLRSFLAYQGFAGEVFIAAGDLNGDGLADIVTGSGAGTQGHVKAFSGADNGLLASFLAYPGFTGGVRVAVGDVDGDGVNDIITGAGAGGGPHVKAFDGRTQALKLSVFAGSPLFAGGVFVA